MMPVTLLAALNEPILTGRAAYSSRAATSAWTSTCPSASSGIVTTSAIDSRHGSSLLWCSKGPMKTTGRCCFGMVALKPYRRSRSAGMRNPRIPTTLSIAAVDPLPVKITTVSSVPCTLRWMAARASSRNLVVCSPVPDASVWVFA
jgi:hypothetical protein